MPHRPPTACLALLALLVGGNAWAKSKKDPPPEDLARIYVLYSEPPFAHEKGELVRIRLLTLWDRDRKEQEIRKEVARLGADAVILERSFMEWDSVMNTATEPGPRGGRTMLKVPTRTAYVEGHLVHRTDGTPCACERPYAVAFDVAWQGVHDTASALSWRWDKVDTDSRSLTTHPVAAADALLCEGESPPPPAVLTVWVRTYGKASVVRLDVRAPGSGCRSSGAVEKVFFEKLERRLG